MVLSTAHPHHAQTGGRARSWMVKVLVALVLAIGVTSTPVVSDTLHTTPSAAAAPQIKLCSGSGTMAGLGLLGGCRLAQAARGAVKDAASSGFKSVVQSLWSGLGKMLQIAMAWFVLIPTPKYQQFSAITEIQQATVGIQLFGLALSILIGSYRLIMARRNAAMQEAEESYKSLAKSVFGAWMFGGVLTTATTASDSLAIWMLAKATGGDQSGFIAKLFAVGLLGQLGSGLVFIIAIVGILAALLQAVVLVARQSMLAVIVALIPIVGSLGGTMMGKNAFGKCISWTISLMLWKPVAAAVYWVAFRMGASHTTSPEQILMGLILVCLVAFVLPLLTKMISGGMAMSGGSGLTAGMMAMGAVAAGGKVAAMAATGGASGAAGAAAGGGGASTATMAGAGGSGGGGGGSQPGGGTGSSPKGGGGGGSQPGGGTSNGSSNGGGGAPSPAATGSGSSSSGGGSASTGGVGGAAGQMAAGAVFSAAGHAESFLSEDYEPAYADASSGGGGNYR